jgi:hypothetical protein
MTTCTANTSGYADIGSNFVGGIAPGAGDDIVKNNGVTLTFRGNTPTFGNIGISAEGSADAGGFVLEEDCYLSFTGDIMFRPSGLSYFTIGPGVTIDHTSTGNNNIRIGWFFNYGAALNPQGTAQKRCVIKHSGSSGSLGVQSSDGANWIWWGGQWTGQYLTFKNIKGDVGIRKANCTNYIFDEDCGNVNLEVLTANTFDINGISFLNPDAVISISGTKTNACSISNLICKGTLQKQYTAANMVFLNPVILKADNYIGDEHGSYSILFTTKREYSPHGPVDGFYNLQRNAGGNPHFFAIGNYAGDIKNGFFRYDGSESGDTGDCINATITASKTINIENCVVRPDNVGKTSGVLLAPLGGSNAQFKIKNCNASFFIMHGESAAGYAGEYAELINCLMVHTETGLLNDRFLNVLTGGATDAVTLADYNCRGGVSNPYNTPTYDDYYASAPGSNDVFLTPSFVDYDYDIEDWAVELGCDPELTISQKIDYAIDALCAANDINDPNYNADATIENLLAAMANANTTKNSELATAGSGGTWIGAHQPKTGNDCTIDMSDAGDVFAAEASMFMSAALSMSESGDTLSVETAMNMSVSLAMLNAADRMKFFAIGFETPQRRRRKMPINIQWQRCPVP